ncbi:hypothetical protein K5D43_21530 [Pseudomonas cichorii]|nr:hypothetical protein [Pseudomonas cichorii]MBX8557061.1 hypothetical protein [Pseudomonas cichorii]
MQKKQAVTPDYTYALKKESEHWSNDDLAAFVSDNELIAGSVIVRGLANKPSASSFLPDADDVVQHMFERAHDDHSEYCDSFPDVTPEAEAELQSLLEPLKAWAEKHCEVRFYTVEKIAPYTVTAADVAAAERYRHKQERCSA